VKISPKVLAIKLALTVLVPTVVGMALRASSKRLRGWVAYHKTALSMFSIFNLIMIQWQALSGARDVLLHQSPRDVIVALAATIAIHVFYLLFNHLVVKLLPGVGIREEVTLTVMVSQKSSAVVGITIISYITEDLAQQGLFAIPCLIGHQAQIFISSLVVKKLAVIVTEQEKQLVVVSTTPTSSDGGTSSGDVTESGDNSSGDGSSIVGVRVMNQATPPPPPQLVEVALPVSDRADPSGASRREGEIKIASLVGTGSESYRV